MDVKTSFLKWIFIKEELYMMQPEGFVDPKGTMQPPAIHLWTGVSISELEYTL